VRIGIDASCWANRRGYGRYTRELVTAILDADTANEYILFLDAATERQCPDLPGRARRVVIPTRSAAADAASAAGHRSLGDLWAMARAVSSRSHEIDVFYFPTVYTFFPVPARLRPMVTVHDTIAERHPHLVFPHWQNRLFWKLKVAWAVRQAAQVITVSNTAKAAVSEYFGLDPRAVRVVSDAVSAEFRPVHSPAELERLLAAHGLAPAGRFILYVGGISPHKNIEPLVEAFCSLMDQESLKDVKLVLVGDYKGDVFFSSYQTLLQRVKALRAEQRVIFTGFVPDADLPHWYSAAEVLVLPSVDEGFGLPALEAMACGTAVVASRGGALPEVVGDAGILFDPRSIPELRDALERLLTDAPLREGLAAKGLERAPRFTWEASARSAIALFQEVAAR
jgi:glycosyltransferase involved in cell wall biosynthesis